MELISNGLTAARQLLPLLVTVTLVIAVLMIVNRVLKGRWREKPDAQYRFQVIMLLLSFVGVLAIIVALPITDSLRGQLLSLIGLLLSAAIALSSTTFIGNVMAGIMLKVIRSARPGDFITLGNLTGRITKMDLLHTEVQTEFRDLVTVPNLYMVTQPLQVVRASGTIISAEVSLGYELVHAEVRELLCAAAKNAGLSDAFAHVRELGDFSVTYRVAGLLEDVQSLISSRSKLRAEMLDTLHAAGIEIVSPNFMNTRPLPEDKKFIPRPSHKTEPEDAQLAEEIAFDKAAEAASVEEIRKAIEKIDAELSPPADENADEMSDAEVARLEAGKTRLLAKIAQAEKERKKNEDG